MNELLANKYGLYCDAYLLPQMIRSNQLFSYSIPIQQYHHLKGDVNIDPAKKNSDWWGIFAFPASVYMASNTPSCLEDVRPFKVVLYDAQCVMCHWSTRFLIRWDHGQHFKLVSVQSPIGQAILQAHGFSTERFDTVVLVECGTNVFTESTAVLRIASSLGFPWRALGLALYVPLWVRDGCYKFVARNRFSFVGRSEQCIAPSENHKGHFLENCIVGWKDSK